MAASDWIEWKGGECPVDPSTIVKVRLRGESVQEAASYPDHQARWHNWALTPRHKTPGIVAYRVVQA